MALNLYRRHGSHCSGGRSAFETTYESDEVRRGWKHCRCPIYASGTIAGKFKRKNTEQILWPDAKAIASDWHDADSWDGRVAPPVRVALPTPDPGRITVAEAVSIFLSHREGSRIQAPTLRKYRTFARQLMIFAESRGYMMIDQFSASDIDRFYAGWKIGARTKGKKLGTLRAFFRFCTNREWLKKNPVSPDLKPPIGASRVANKAPFTDEELARIIDACDLLGEVVWSNASETGTYSGEDVKDFIWTMIYTGLRISDVGFFTMNRLKGNEVFLRAKKNGGEVFAYIPDWLRDRLNHRAERFGDRPFVVGRSDRMDTVTDMWRRKINKAFQLAGAFEEPPTPHRFRHTFARILLQRGVPVADVADLLGDEEKTVRQHYARWVPERQARLTRILKDAFDDKPRPQPVAVRR